MSTQTAYHCIAMDHIRTLKDHAAILYTDESHYGDPAKLDPANLGEIQHALDELRKVAGMAAAEAA